MGELEEIGSGDVLFDQESMTYTVTPGGSIQDQKEKMVEAIDHAIGNAPRDDVLSGASVEWDKPKNRSGDRVIEILFNGVHTRDGYSLVRDQFRKMWTLMKCYEMHGAAPKIGNEFTNVKDAKLFAEAYLKGETESDKIVVFRGGDYVYRIPNSRYHLGNLKVRVVRGRGILY